MIFAPGSPKGLNSTGLPGSKSRDTYRGTRSPQTRSMRFTSCLRRSIITLLASWAHFLDPAGLGPHLDKRIYSARLSLMKIGRRARHWRGCAALERPRLRADGWKELKLGQFYNAGGEDDVVSFSLMDTKRGMMAKGGLLLHGVVIRCQKSC